LALTREYTAPARWMLSQRIADEQFYFADCFVLTGTHVLAFFGISLPVVQVSGGLIVISTGWSLLKEKEEDDRGRRSGKWIRRIFPGTRFIR